MGLYRFQAAFFVGDGGVIWFLRLKPLQNL